MRGVGWCRPLCCCRFPLALDVDLAGRPGVSTDCRCGCGARSRSACRLPYPNERPGAAVLDDGRERFLLALVPLPAAVDELETVGSYPAGGAALLLEHLQRC